MKTESNLRIQLLLAILMGFMLEATAQLSLHPVQIRELEPGMPNKSLLEQRQQLSRQWTSRLAQSWLSVPITQVSHRNQMPLSSAAGAVFRSTLIYDEDWRNTMKYGLYDLDANTMEITGYFSDPEGIMHPDYGGAIIGDLYYMVIGYDFGGYATFYLKYVFNMATLSWVANLSELIPNQDITYLSWSNTPYDTETGLCYGSFYNSAGTSLEFCSMDYPTLTRTFIANPEHAFIVMAINESDHQLYGIDTNGDLYKINKSNGEETFVGSTGITPSQYHQAAVIDDQYDILYWTYIDSQSNCGLAEVDLETGGSNSTPFNKLIQFGDLYLIAHGVNDQAPGMVENLTWVPNTSNYEWVDVSFTMPTKSNDGITNLSNALTYKLTWNEEILAEGKANPGEQVTVTLNQLPLQTPVKIGVSVENEGGTSGLAYTDVWAGKDIPASVTNATLSITDNQASLSWDACEGSEHGGYIDPTTIGYRITRYPDGLIMGITSDTTYDDEVDTSHLCYYYYSIEAVADGLASSATFTNKVKVGEAMLPPYYIDFLDYSEIENYWDIKNNNKDEETWFWNPDGYGMQINLSSYGNNDWLVSPPFEMKKGYEYVVSFAAYTSLGGMMEMTYGTNDYPATYELLLDAGRLPQDEPMTYEARFRPEEDRNYRFGLHEMSSHGIYTCVTMFSVGPAVPFDSPGAPTDFTATVSPGQHTVELSFKLPTNTLDGSPLTELDDVRIYRDRKLIATLTDGLSPGGEMHYSDCDLDMEGLVSYGVSASNLSGEGEQAVTTAFIGLDAPQAPVIVNFVDNNDGTITLNWNNPSIGRHGGYVDVDNLDNVIYKIENNQVGDKIATIHGSDNYTQPEDLSGDPGWFYWGVAAMDAVHSESAITVARLIKGTAVGLPFEESFADKQIHRSRFWWATPLSGDTNWSLSSRSVTGDGGSLSFITSEAGNEGVIGSRKISLDGAMNPILDFHYYSQAEGTGILYVEIDRSQRGQIDVVGEYDMSTMNAEGGWKHVTIDLTPYLAEPYVLIRFHAKGTSAGDIIGVDDVMIVDEIPNDLAISIDAPVQLHTGEIGKIMLTVSNEGSNPSGNYHYSLTGTYTNEAGEHTLQLLDGDGTDLSAYGGKTVIPADFVVTPFMNSELTLFATVTHEGDARPSNDTATASILLSENTVPTINDLTATDEGGSEVTLTWTPPTDEVFGSVTITEDFENYAPWDLEMGDWDNYDGDGGVTGGIFNEVAYPHQGSPFSFIIFNPNDLVANATQQVPMLKPHSGNQFAAAIYSMNAERTDFLDQDNWLISPELTGQAQAISFYAKNLSEIYPNEQFEVLFSMTDNQPGSFEKIGDTFTVSDPYNWTPINVELPVGAKYFAIRNVTGKDDTFMLMIDDITFTKKADSSLSITGYNVYVDGDLYQTLNGEGTTAKVGPIGFGEHAIYMTVLYGADKIESPLSNKASVVTSINDIMSCDELDCLDVVVYTASGIQMAEGRNVSGLLPRGIYLVKEKKSGMVRSFVRK